MLSGGNQAVLDLITSGVSQLALAEGTRKNYRSIHACFCKFCDLFGFAAFPTEPEVLVRYVAYSCVVVGRTLGTIRNHLSAIRRDHLAHGLSLPTPTQFLPLADVLKGAERFQSRPVVKKWPIHPKLLSRMVAYTLPGSPIRSLFIMLFVTFARLESLIPKTAAAFNVTAHLTWGDVQFRQGCVRVKLRKTKTIQCGERVLTFNIPELENKSLCLVYNLSLWRQVSPLCSDQDPVFSVCEGGSWVPLSRASADQALKGALTLAGVQHSRYGWSSFRRGGATTFWLATGDLEMLRVQGDWQSLAYREYLSLPSKARAGVAAVLLGGLR